MTRTDTEPFTLLGVPVSAQLILAALSGLLLTALVGLALWEWLARA